MKTGPETYGDGEVLTASQGGAQVHYKAPNGDHFIVSHASCINETAAFRCDEHGNVTDHGSVIIEQRGYQVPHFIDMLDRLFPQGDDA